MYKMSKTAPIKAQKWLPFHVISSNAPFTEYDAFPEEKYREKNVGQKSEGC